MGRQGLADEPFAFGLVAEFLEAFGGGRSVPREVVGVPWQLLAARYLVFAGSSASHFVWRGGGQLVAAYRPPAVVAFAG